MRKKDGTLRGTLLDHARHLANAEGAGAVNIRSIAQRAGVASGTVYNYFSNKDEILLALTEEYWKETLLEMRAAITAGSFCGQLEEMFAFLRERVDSSAGMFMHSLENVEAAGRERMTSMQIALEAAMVRQMEQDINICKDAWNETFTKGQYARFIMTNMMALLRTEQPDIQFFIAIVKRTIYPLER